MTRRILLLTASVAIAPVPLGIPAPAAATLTIGQVAPGGPPPAMCAGSPADDIQPVVTSGGSYVIPGPGTIVSWTTNGAVGAGQMMKMKVFRNVVDPDTWEVVGSDLESLAAGGGTAGNTFPAHISVEPGDVLGANQQNAKTVPNACRFTVPSTEQALVRVGDLASGFGAPFNSYTDTLRINVSAQFYPSNSFSLGGVVRARTTGTATQLVNVPNAGRVSLSGKGLKPTSAETTGATSPFSVSLPLSAKGSQRRKLNQRGRVVVGPNITYTPTGGDPRMQSTTVRLLKKR